MLREHTASEQRSPAAFKADESNEDSLTLNNTTGQTWQSKFIRHWICGGTADYAEQTHSPKPITSRQEISPFQMKRLRKNKKEDTKRQQQSEQKRSFQKPDKEMAPLVSSTSIQICLNAGFGLCHCTS